MAAAQQEENIETCGKDSHLAKFLLEKYAWGEMSPQLIQKISSLVVQDFELAKRNSKILDDLHTLAGIGTMGSHPNKCHADLMTKVEKLSKLPDPFKVTIPFKPPLGDAPQGLLLPHEMFSAVYHGYPETFKRSILNNAAALEGFWTSVEQHPQIRGHPIKNVANYKSKVIPLAVHGDGVPIVGLGKGWSRVMTLFSWYSLVGQGHTRELLFWIWGAYDRLMKGAVDEGTRGKFFAVLAWSFETMMSGVWPRADFEGKELLEQVLVQHVEIFLTCWVDLDGVIDTLFKFGSLVIPTLRATGREISRYSVLKKMQSKAVCFLPKKEYTGIRGALLNEPKLVHYLRGGTAHAFSPSQGILTTLQAFCPCRGTTWQPVRVPCAAAQLVVTSPGQIFV